MTWDEWRATIPFSNEHIADVLAQEACAHPHCGVQTGLLIRAEALRGGARLSKHDIRRVASRIVNHCGICGKIALYRYGLQGRCKLHRLDKPRFAVKAEYEREKRLTEKEQHWHHVERERKRRDVAQAYRIRMKHKV